MRLFAIYDRTDGLEPIVWPIFQCRSGEFFPLQTLHMPAISPLPLSVHKTRLVAERALARYLYACAGCA